MSTFPGREPHMAADHRRLAAQQSAPPPPPGPSPAAARRRYRRRQREMERQFNALGARFAAWARSQGYQPVRHTVGRGWKIGQLQTGSIPMPSDPGPGEAMRAMRGHPNWYVLHNGKVTTDDNAGAALVGSQPNTSRFIEVVRANWGCELGRPLAGPGRTPADEGPIRPDGWFTG